MSTSRSSFLSLPTELHNLILSHLSEAYNLHAVSRTCRYLSTLVAPYLFSSAVKAKHSHALRWAASVNNVEFMTRLLRAGVDVSATEIRDEGGFGRRKLGGLKYKTALEITLEAGHMEALRVLWDHGDTVRGQLLKGGMLLAPVVRGDLPMLELLLEYIPSGQLDERGNLAWDHVISVAIGSGKVETVEFFLDRGFRVSDPLHQAASEGHLDIAKLLLERGVIEDIGGRSAWWNHMTAMDLAAKFGQVHLMELVLENGAEVDCTSEEGIKPVHYAAESGGVDAVKFLVQNGVDVNAPSNDGTTPIHEAARYNQYSTLEALIEMGGDVNVPDNDHHAALYHAARASPALHILRSEGDDAYTYGVDLAWLLLRNGAVVDQRDLSGLTAKDAAVRGGWIGMAKTLSMASTAGGIENVADSLEELYENLNEMDRDDEWF
jgi:ankyrin repeat protein